MALLRTPFGCLTSTIFRLAALAAVAALLYLLVLKPGLEKTGEAIDSRTRAVRQLADCIGRSHGDIQRLERCARRF